MILGANELLYCLTSPNFAILERKLHLRNEILQNCFFRAACQWKGWNSFLQSYWRKNGIKGKIIQNKNSIMQIINHNICRRIWYYHTGFEIWQCYHDFGNTWTDFLAQTTKKDWNQFIWWTFVCTYFLQEKSWENLNLNRACMILKNVLKIFNTNFKKVEWKECCFEILLCAGTATVTKLNYKDSALWGIKNGKMRR